MYLSWPYEEIDRLKPALKYPASLKTISIFSCLHVDLDVAALAHVQMLGREVIVKLAFGTSLTGKVL